MRKLFVICLCLLMSPVVHAATVSYEYVPGLSFYTFVCETTRDHSVIIDEYGELFHSVDVVHSLDEVVEKVNRLVIHDTFYVDIAIKVSLYCHNGARVDYKYNNDRLRHLGPIIMKAPYGCQ